jgi:hypothetical protein
MLRVAELRKRHIIGAKVRLYCVKHERCPVAIPQGEGEAVELETAYFVSHPLSLMNGPSSPGANNEEEPNSNTTYEQNILMGLPHVVVHKMDSLSPLLPPRPFWYDEGGTPHGPFVGISTTDTVGNSGLGEDAAPSRQVEEIQILAQGSISTDEFIDFLQDRQAEIIVFLEGTCETTGLALQARQSYRLEDIAFHHTFAPCVFPVIANRRRSWNPFTRKRSRVDDANSRDDCDEGYAYNRDAVLEIDFSRFHQLLPSPRDSVSCPFVPSSTFG